MPHSSSIHKSQIKCPYCEEEKDIIVCSYRRNSYDTPDTGIEMHCRACNEQFHPMAN